MKFFASANALVTRYETALSKANEEAEAKYVAAAKKANAEARQFRDEIKRLQEDVAAAKDETKRRSSELDAEREKAKKRKDAAAQKAQEAYDKGYIAAKTKYLEKSKEATSEAGRLAEWIEGDGMSRFYQLAQAKENLDFMAELEAGRHRDLSVERARVERFVEENASVEEEIEATFLTIYDRLGHKCAPQPPPEEETGRLDVEAQRLGVTQPSGSNEASPLVEALLQERRAESLAGTPRAVVLAATMDVENVVERIEALEEISDGDGVVASDVAVEATVAVVVPSVELLATDAGDETVGPEPVTQSAEVEGETGAEAETVQEDQMGTEAEITQDDAVETEEGELVQT